MYIKDLFYQVLNSVEMIQSVSFLTLIALKNQYIRFETENYHLF